MGGHRAFWLTKEKSLTMTRTENSSRVRWHLSVASFGLSEILSCIATPVSKREAGGSMASVSVARWSRTGQRNEPSRAIGTGVGTGLDKLVSLTRLAVPLSTSNWVRC